MGNFIKTSEKLVGRLNAQVLSVFFKGISRQSSIISSSIYGAKKLILNGRCYLYRCTIRICDDSKSIEIGAGTLIEANALLNAHKGSIWIGKGCFVGPNVIIQGMGGVIIGDGTMIAGNSFISSSNHIFDGLPDSEALLKEVAQKTTIGEKTWIGSNVVVLAGVSIGRRCVIGAGSVVTKDIPDFSVAVGSPAKVIKSISSIA